MAFSLRQHMENRTFDCIFIGFISIFHMTYLTILICIKSKPFHPSTQPKTILKKRFVKSLIHTQLPFFSSYVNKSEKMVMLFMNKLCLQLFLIESNISRKNNTSYNDAYMYHPLPIFLLQHTAILSVITLTAMWPALTIITSHQVVASLVSHQSPLPTVAWPSARMILCWTQK